MKCHALGLLLLSVVAGCSHDAKPAATASAPVPAPEPSSETTVTSAVSTTTIPASPSLSVSDELAKKCDLRLGDPATAPKFDFDRSDLDTRDHEVLDEISDCITSGPLAGHKLLLIGRADPRGTTDYNLALGARRAHEVAAYFELTGVQATQLKESSRGALDASGSDEASWQTDRRVDLLLSE